METLTGHPMAAIFPEIGGDDFTKLVADILSYGVREPVWIYEGKILDGRNRYRACVKAGKDCPTREFTGSRQEALALVWSMNRERRHLTPSQAAAAETIRAQLSIEYATEIEKLKAEARKKAGRPKKGEEKSVEFVPQISANDRKTNTIRAKAAGTNRKYLEAAEKLSVSHPEKLDEVLRGEKTIPQAMRELKARQQASTPPTKPASSGPALFEPDGTPRVPGMTLVEEWKLVRDAIEHMAKIRKALDKCESRYGLGEKSLQALSAAYARLEAAMKPIVSRASANA